MSEGWCGKLLTINFNSGKVDVLTPEPELYKLYIGGTDLAARLLYDRIPEGTAPLAPENVLAILTGPLTGTNFPGCGRVSLAALSPLTDHWGQSSMGGFFGLALKRAGLDGLILTGASENPCYLLIEDDDIKIMDASDLWGRDTYETEAMLRERHPRSEVMCIGPAGENQFPMASVSQRPGKLAGRCGMGAVLGSKKIKAVVVRGTGRVKLADANEFKQLVSRALEIIDTHPAAQAFSQLGTAYQTEGVMMLGDMPVQNWSGEIWQEGAESIGGEAIQSEILTRRTNCHACTIQCKAEVKLDEGDILMDEGPGPEYESLGSLGTMLRHGNLAGVAKANELCNRLGVDTISVGSTIAWAMEAFERGALTTKDTNGLELTWGNTNAILTAIKAIAYGEEGLGMLLTQGSRRAAKQIGKGSEDYAINVKGLDLAMHNPRVFNGLALAYAFLPQGASHMEGGFNQRGRDESIEQWVDQTIQSMRRGELANDAIICSFIASDAPLEFVADLFSSATGEPYTIKRMLDCFDRGYLMRYVFNLKMGCTPKDNVLPERINQQMKESNSRWDVDWSVIESAYYSARGFDEHGHPNEETLRNAGLDDVIPDMALWK